MRPERAIRFALFRLRRFHRLEQGPVLRTAAVGATRNRCGVARSAPVRRSGEEGVWTAGDPESPSQSVLALSWCGPRSWDGRLNRDAAHYKRSDSETGVQPACDRWSVVDRSVHRVRQLGPVDWRRELRYWPVSRSVTLAWAVLTDLRIHLE